MTLLWFAPLSLCPLWFRCAFVFKHEDTKESHKVHDAQLVTSNAVA
jgi:hypothetical protein